MKRPWLLAMFALAACGPTDPTASDDAAIAAATRKAVIDTDAAYRDASARPATQGPEQTADRAG